MTTTVNGTTITLSGTSVSTGFGVGSKYTNFYLTSTGEIGGNGLYASNFLTATNNGEISVSGSSDSVNLKAGGVLFNTGNIYTSGASTSAAINLDGAGSYFSNSSTGEIAAGHTGISLAGGGRVDNAGVIFAAGIAVYLPGGTLDNQGAVSGSQAVEKANSVLNGSTSNTTAAIGGNTYGIVSGGLLTVTNFGTISCRLANGVYAGSGTVTNGSALSTGANIFGTTGGVVSSGSLTLSNFGMITESGNKFGNAAVSLLDGGGILNDGHIAGKNIGIYGRDGSLQVVNGSALESSAQIYGTAEGILSGTLTLTNFGTIEASGTKTSSIGVELGVGTVTNGSVVSTKALIEGYADGVTVVGRSIPIENFATIRSTAVGGGGIGVSLQGAYGDTVTNGAATDDAALIQGYAAALYVKFAGSVVNLGTLDGTGRYGLEFAASCQIMNGSSADTAATVYGGRDAIEGLAASGSISIQNFGTVLAADVAINAPGSAAIVNGSVAESAALISSQGTAIALGTGSAIVNFGTIAAGGVGVMMASGTVTNGSRFATRALIAGYAEGIYGTASDTTVANYGTIRSTEIGTIGNGIFLQGIAGVRVANGSAGDTTALIQGYAAAISLSAGTIDNFGTLDATGGYGVLFNGYARIVNGSAQDKSALIAGYHDGIFGFDNVGVATVANYGSITGDDIAVYMQKSATVTNGTGTDKTALLEGQEDAVVLTDGGSVRNFGIIYGATGQGVSLTNGGTVTNGSPTSTAATIESYGDAVYATDAFGHIINYGTIRVDGQGVSLALEDGGSVINGNVHDGGASITGDEGVLIIGGAGTVVNFGTIEALGVGQAYSGVFLADGGSITNGAAGKALGLIEGQIGIQLSNGGAATNFGTIEGDQVAGAYLVKGGTITNFGTIEGTSGADAVLCHAGGLLVAEAGSDFIGVVNGGGGTLEVLGAGTLSGLLIGGNVTVSGSLEKTTAFTDFGAVDVGAGASFLVAGNGTIALGKTLVVAGTVSEAGTLVVAGGLVSSGTIAGTGRLTLGGVATLNAGTSLTVAGLSITGGTTNFKTNLAYAGSFSQSGGNDGIGTTTLTFNGAAAFSGGTVSGNAGGFLVTTAAVQLSAFDITVGAAWQNSGSVTDTGSLTLGSSGHSGSFANLAGGIFDITANGGGVALAVTSSGGSSNAGLFEKTGGTGLSTVAGNFANTGTIAVTAGTLDLTGAVSGTGTETIGIAGTLAFAGSVAATQTINFAGATGALVLGDPSGSGLSFSGLVKGFTGSDRIDLSTIAYAGTQATFSQSGSSGTLTVTEGSNIAKIMLFGQYAAGNFTAASDGASGTLITYVPTAPAISMPHH